MYLLFIFLVSLALGPDVKLLNAEELTSMSMQITVFSQVPESSPGENSYTSRELLNNKSLTTEAKNVVQTSYKHMMTPTSGHLINVEHLTTPEHLTTAEHLTTPEHLINVEHLTTAEHLTTTEHLINVEHLTTAEHLTTTEHLINVEHLTTAEHLTTPEHLTTAEYLTIPESTAIPVHTIMTPYALSTPPAAKESMSPPEQQETTMINIITTEAPQTSSQSSTIPYLTNMNAEPSVSGPKTASNEEDKTTDTSPTTTPTETPDRSSWTHFKEITSTTDQDSRGADFGRSKDNEDSKKGTNWLIIAVIGLVIFCILTTFCVLVFIKHKKKIGKQNFGYMNGQRSKKKKAAEDDVWAGPVKLGGGDCEAPEEGDARGEEKKTDGVEETGLSTFSTLEENGGVGRPGSPEVEKWEEKEPLLFIDEEGKGKGKSEVADSNDEVGKTDVKEAEPNGGETFCLTTAV